jgi:hypothetical protein
MVNVEIDFSVDNTAVEPEMFAVAIASAYLSD